jgi:hypothetical protein
MRKFIGDNEAPTMNGAENKIFCAAFLFFALDF